MIFNTVLQYLAGVCRAVTGQNQLLSRNAERAAYSPSISAKKLTFISYQVLAISICLDDTSMGVANACQY